MNTPQETSILKREFELERMILFSDAVFAIAITLLVIDIKFPEIGRNETNAEIRKAFQPVVIRFFGFALSFLFIGVMWARHLEIFKYLRSYDKGVIIRNLCFLFFIVCFPFVVTGFTENIRNGFMFPVIIYFVNICCTVVAQFAICHYIFKSRKELSSDGNEPQKKYLLLQSGYNAFIFVITSVIMWVVYLVTKGDFLAIIFSLYALPILMFFTRRRLKKFKPVKESKARVKRAAQ